MFTIYYIYFIFRKQLNPELYKVRIDHAEGLCTQYQPAKFRGDELNQGPPSLTWLTLINLIICGPYLISKAHNSKHTPSRVLAIATEHTHTSSLFYPLLLISSLPSIPYSPHFHTHESSKFHHTYLQLTHTPDHPILNSTQYPLLFN